jgi:biotin-(acetyl-CoA carboxylase) ligase
LGQPADRVEVLHDILKAFLALRPIMLTDEFVAQWEGSLAFHGETVQVETGNLPPTSGKISGLDPDGSLRLLNEHGETVTVRFGDVRLRPLA